jgi:excisionase family DNA binding protein
MEKNSMKSTATASFHVQQSKNADGSFTVRPVKIVDDRMIGIDEAAKILCFRDKKSVYPLISAGIIRAWKPETRRGNGKWRINLQSVHEYKEHRERIAREGY